MESIYTELALYGSRNECTKTDNVFSPISEVCDGTVSLVVVNTMYARTCRGRGGRLSGWLVGEWVPAQQLPGHVFR